MNRSQFITNELIDINLKHLEDKYETQRNRLSKYDLIDLEHEHLLSNINDLLANRLESLGYINLHGEIITMLYSTHKCNTSIFEHL